MDETNKDKNPEVTPEEQKAEQEALGEIKEDDLRTKLAEEYGIDPDTEGELLNKIVAREKEHHAKLAGAIKQKRSWRERAEGKISKDEDPKKPTQKKDSNPEDAEKALEIRLQAKFDERDLKELDLPEDIESEVKDMAKLKGISVREAVKLPYIVSIIKEYADKVHLEKGTPKRKKDGSATVIDLSKPLNPADFDFTTEAGRKEWSEAKAARAAARNKS